MLVKINFLHLHFDFLPAKLGVISIRRVMLERRPNYIWHPRAFIPKPMRHIAYSPYFNENFQFPHISAKCIHFPPISAKFTSFVLNLRVPASHNLTMMHLCIMLYTYWTPLGTPFSRKSTCIESIYISNCD